MRTRLVWFVTLLSSVVSVCAICIADSPAPSAKALSLNGGSAYTTADLIAAVAEQLTSIDTLYCECEKQFSNSTKVTKFRYARSGGKWHYMTPTSDGKESTSCYDGSYEYTFIVGHPRENPKSWTTVQLHDPRKSEILGPEGLLGTMIYNLRRSIVDILESAKDVTMSEQILPDGTAGFRLVAKDVTRAGPGARGGYVLAVTLDPAHDFLPREVLVTRPDNPNWSENWKVLDYRQVLDEKTGKKRWFPVSGTLESVNPDSVTMKLTIRDVRINGDLAPALFHPDIPNGVTLEDVTSTGKGSITVKGGDPATDKRIRELSLRAKSYGRGRNLFNWSILVLLIIASSWLLYRISRKSKSRVS